ncbi:MAG: hypothetical protein RJA36_3567 [Pseudomonadota bacterium]
MLFRKPPMARPVNPAELPSLQAKRAAAIQSAGTRWLLHPANAVRRKTPAPRWVVLGIIGLTLLAGAGNTDMDGRVRLEPQLAGAP